MVVEPVCVVLGGRGGGEGNGGVVAGGDVRSGGWWGVVQGGDGEESAWEYESLFKHLWT